MRYLLFTITLLLVSLPLAAQQQYTDGACILLQQQIDRFDQQRQNSNYRSAKREYDRYCQKPVHAVPLGSQARQAVPVTTAPAESTENVTTPPTPVKAVTQAEAERSATVSAEARVNGADSIKPAEITSADVSAV